MKIVEMAKSKSGARRNQTIGHLSKIPDGWAVIPNDLKTENFPFGDMKVEQINGVPTVTAWMPLPIPETELEPEIESEPTISEILDALLGVLDNE